MLQPILNPCAVLNLSHSIAVADPGLGPGGLGPPFQNFDQGSLECLCNAESRKYRYFMTPGRGFRFNNGWTPLYTNPGSATALPR